MIAQSRLSSFFGKVWLIFPNYSPCLLSGGWNPSCTTPVESTGSLGQLHGTPWAYGASSWMPCSGPVGKLVWFYWRFLPKDKKKSFVRQWIVSFGFFHTYLFKSNIEWYFTKPFKPKYLCLVFTVRKSFSLLKHWVIGFQPNIASCISAASALRLIGYEKEILLIQYWAF